MASQEVIGQTTKNQSVKIIEVKNGTTPQGRRGTAEKTQGGVGLGTSSALIGKTPTTVAQ